MKKKCLKYLSLILVVCLLFSSMAIAFAENDSKGFEKKYILKSSNYSEENITYKILNSNLIISGKIKQDLNKYDKIAVLDMVGEGEQNQIKNFGGINSDGTYSIIVNLYKLNEGKSSLAVYFGAVGSDSLMSKYYVAVKKENNEFFFPTTVADTANDLFTDFLNMLNPKDHLSLENLKGNADIYNKAKEITKNCKSDYEKIYVIHNWISNELYYDYDAIITNIRGNNDPDFVFKNKYCVCQGYAELANVMLRSIGVPSIWVGGMGENIYNIDWDSYDVEKNPANHAWNVAFDGTRWVTFDSTWDSYNTYLNSKKEYKGYGLTYFDVTNQGFSIDHRTVVIPNTVELKKDNFTYIFDEGTIQLINYTGSDTKVTIPSIARSITTASFKSTISELTIGKNIVFIEPYAISKFTKIICYKNSYAHKYAVDNGYNFELISNDIEKLEITNAPSSLSVGEQLKLNIKISPLDAENKNLVFSSSDENIATIDNNGTITAKKKGNVTITVKTKDNLIFTSCNFNVKNIAISEIVVLNKSFSIEKDNTLQINTIITPENATNKTLIYESSNEDIATVDKNGLITAKEKGNAIIKIKSAEDNTQVTININVYIKGEEILIEKIQMDKTEYYLSVDDILNFKLTLTPSNATNTNVTFTSSNNNILKCENDIIKGVSSGKVTLTVTSPNDENIKTSCTVNVYLTGDANKDNKINTLDALYILKYIAKIDVFTELQAVAADFNKDGKINTLDALNVLKKVAQIK